jgi:hypothetical protein
VEHCSLKWLKYYTSIEPMQTFIRALCLVFGLMLLYAGGLLYEDEVKGIQNRLEDWWVRLDDARHFAFRRERHFLERFVALLSSLMDGVFGRHLFSRQAVASSISLSVAGIAVASSSVSYFDLDFFSDVNSNNPIRLGPLSVIVICCFISIALVILSRWRWAAAAICASVFFFGSFEIDGKPPGSGDAFSCFVPSDLYDPAWVPGWVYCSRFFAVSLAVPLSIASDFCTLMLVRVILRRAAASRLRGTVLALIIAAVVAGAATALPLFIALHEGSIGDWSGHHYRQTLAIAGEYLTLLNADVGIFLLCLMIVALVLLLHRFIWPAVLRLLYLVQGSGVLTQRKSLLSIGLALTSAAVLSPAGIVTVVKGLIGLK